MKTDFTNKLIAALFAILMSLSGIAYAGVTQRIGALEQDRRNLVEVAEAIRIQTAVMSEQILTLQNSNKIIAIKLDSIDANQKETTQKINAIVITLNQNSKDYQNALRHWMDIFDKVNKGK